MQKSIRQISSFQTNIFKNYYKSADNKKCYLDLFLLMVIVRIIFIISIIVASKGPIYGLGLH